MPEWIAVTIAGAVGGTANIVMTGTAVRPYRYRSPSGGVRTDYTLMGAVFLGAVAGFVF